MTPTERLVKKHWDCHRPKDSLLHPRDCIGAWKRVVKVTGLPASRVIAITNKLDANLMMFTWELDDAVQRVNRYEVRKGGMPVDA